MNREKIEFLDLEIYGTSNKLQCKTFVKPTAKNSYIQFNSCHLPRWLINVPKGQFRRLKRNCTLETQFQEEAKNLTSQFIEKQYPIQIIEKSLSEVNKLDRKTFFENQSKEIGTWEQQPKIVLPYNIDHKTVEQILRKHWYLAQNDKSIGSILPKNPPVIYKKAPNLGITIAPTVSDKLPKANKTRIWQEICSKVNALGVVKRSIANIIHKWYDCKRQVKEKLKKIDQHSKQTGGGPAIEIKPSQTEEIVADTFRREQISGIGSFDVVAGIEDTNSSDGDELIPESPGPSSIVSQQDSSTSLPSGQHISEEDTIPNLSQKLTQYISKNEAFLTDMLVKQGEIVQVVSHSSSNVCHELCTMTNVLREVRHLLQKVVNQNDVTSPAITSTKVCTPSPPALQTLSHISPILVPSDVDSRDISQQSTIFLQCHQ
ncbi:uncharacterized protein LOC130291892 [Hyla sarda]|uniref:uncharacterized protein LOC130291892 n=1 Tax=Hyla sarda TaxID=327740 RepID=UPI0024C3C618|nr:uncharacterized protein LOC130291892 [Hyla sarda]